MSVVSFSRPGPSDQVSPSIWGDCPNTLLEDLGLGFFRDIRFDGRSVTALMDEDNDSVTYAQLDGERGGGISVTTGSSDNNAAALFLEPMGRIVKNSGNKLWFEAIVAPGDVDADLGFFVGLTERDALDGTTGSGARDVVADDAGSNALIDESCIGFIQDNGDDDAFDAIYKKDDGTAVNPATDVTNDSALDSDEQASLTDGAFWKLGLKFDGKETLSWWVNGVKVAEQTVDDTIDQSHDLGPVLCIKTGAAAAEAFHVKRVRCAFQERH